MNIVNLIQILSLRGVFQTHESVMLVFAFTTLELGLTIRHVVTFSKTSEALLGCDQMGSPVLD
jgi:hypothetical protein